jgi:hypothetical protein
LSHALGNYYAKEMRINTFLIGPASKNMMLVMGERSTAAELEWSYCSGGEGILACPELDKRVSTIGHK